MVATNILAAGVGGLFWTVCEYAAHRFAMHDARSPSVFSATHRAHHVDPAATIALRRALSYLALAAAAVPIWLIAAAVIGTGRATVFAVAWWLGYGCYEQVHWGFHHRRPRSTRAAGLRQRHFAHHFGSPRRNFGVTTSLWDRVLGTYESPESVVIPRQHLMGWVTDGSGAIDQEFADRYAVAPARSRRPG